MTTNNSRSRSKRSRSRSRSRSPVKFRVRSTRLLVSNIAFNTTFNELKDLFKEKIGICGRLDFIEKNGKFTGNATMDFKTLEGAQKAVDIMHKTEINGREIVVREESAKDRERLNLDLPSKVSSLPVIESQNSLSQLVNMLEREGPITNSLFIANLDYTLTWQKLKDLFKSAGRVRHVDLKTDSESKSRGFGTVEFETPEEAVLAIHLFNNKVVNKREIRLRMDKSGQALSGRLNLAKYTDNDSPMPSGNMNSQIKRLFDDILVASSNPSRKNPQALKALDELLSLAKLFEKPSLKSDYDRNYAVGGMPPMRDFESDRYLPSQSYDSPPFNDRERMIGNKSSGGYNNFSSMSRDYPPPGRETEYFESPRNSSSFDMNMVEEMLFKMKNSGNLDQHSLMNVISNVMKRSPEPYTGGNKSYGNLRSSDDFMPSKAATTLLIKNIPFSYTWKDLKVSFSQVPGIEHIEILRDDFNRSKGVGLVRFDSVSDANRCKNMMDGTLLDGRPIHIDVAGSNLGY